MSSTAVAPPLPARRPRSTIPVRELARRSVIRTLRQPASLVPAIVFPMFLLAVNSAGLEAATAIPGFPTDSYLTFALAVPFIQGGIFAVLNGGTDLARDIESGFLDRMALTPISRSGLLMGQLAGVVAIGVLQAIVYIAVGLAAGAGFEGGAAGAFVLLLLSISVAFGFGCIGLFAALRSGSTEAVQGLFPVFFVFLFISSMALPRNLIEIDWFRTVATWNPVSYLIEGFRSIFVEGIEADALALAFAIALGTGAVFLAASAAALRKRVVRT